MKYGARLKAFREKKGWSLQELADKVDSTKSTIAMIERGSRPLSLEMAVKGAEVLEISVMDLIAYKK